MNDETEENSEIIEQHIEDVCDKTARYILEQSLLGKLNAMEIMGAMLISIMALMRNHLKEHEIMIITGECLRASEELQNKYERWKKENGIK